MSLFRSQTLNHYKLILPRDNAEQIMHSLGTTKLIHIQPLNTPLLDRPYIRQMKRCTDCLHRINDIQTLLEQKRLLFRKRELSKYLCHRCRKIQKEFFQECALLGDAGKFSLLAVLDDIDRQIDGIWTMYKDMVKRLEDIVEKGKFMRENLAILRAGLQYLGKSFFMDNHEKPLEVNSQFMEVVSSSVNIKAGVTRVKDELQLKRIAFRISKNNCFFDFVPYSSIFEQVLPQEEDKVVFFFIFSGTKSGTLDKKLEKLITNFSNINYIIPDNIATINKMKTSLEQQISENQNLLKLTQSEFLNYLTGLCEPIPNRNFCQLEVYKIYLLKQKQVYRQLNQMQVYNNFLQASIYVRHKDIAVLHQCLKEVENSSKYPSGQLLQFNEDKPHPTLFTPNKYTITAQQIVQTYGIPCYKEANPSLFTTITFPFLFGVMFGDIAHGSVLFLLGCYLCFFPAYLPYQFLRMLIPHRYMITLMGFFAMYCGLIYNDFMAVSLNLFGSCYQVSQVSSGQPIPRSQGCVYPVGLDPVWGIAINSINFVDSLKMKISVIIGVLHMILGICIKASNAIYFRKKLDFFFEFVPQLAFMICLFGYMDFLIVLKWLHPWSPYESSAPSIITTMINIPLKLGKTENCCGGQPLWDQESQNLVQLILLGIAVLCIPIMLIPKPLIQILRRKNGSLQQEDQEKHFIQFSDLHEQNSIAKSPKKSPNPSPSPSSQSPPHSQSHPEESASEVLVHQLIETIEYVLGSISNTASYLRLWALSLAHSQLSQVFFQKTVESGLVAGFSGIPTMLFGYFVLAGVTLAVLLSMDTMECFLHTLRLHWVEFQNKFYKGNGYPFLVFNFKLKISEELRQG